jgi:hypothetical protein
VLVEPGADDLNIEDGAVGCAYGVLEGLETGGAKVEGEATEGGVAVLVARGGSSADAGGEGVRRRPF